MCRPGHGGSPPDRCRHGPGPVVYRAAFPSRRTIVVRNCVSLRRHPCVAAAQRRFCLSLSGTIRPAFGRGASDGAGAVPGDPASVSMCELVLKRGACWSRAPSSLGLRWDRDEGDVTGAFERDAQNLANNHSRRAKALLFLPSCLRADAQADYLSRCSANLSSIFRPPLSF